MADPSDITIESMSDMQRGDAILDSLTVKKWNGSSTSTATAALTVANGLVTPFTGTLIAGINRFTTVANTGDIVFLPAGIPGMMIYVLNSAPNNSYMNVSPPPGGTIHDQAVGNSSAIAQGGHMTLFICIVPGTWASLASA